MGNDEQQSTPSTSPVLDVRQNGIPVPSASLDAVATLIHSFFGMMQGVEKRITDRIIENAEASKERWARSESIDSERWKQWEARFDEYCNITNEHIEVVEIKIDDHLKAEEKAEERMDARVRPVQNVLSYASRHWRTIALAAVVIVDVVGRLVHP